MRVRSYYMGYGLGGEKDAGAGRREVRRPRGNEVRRPTSRAKPCVYNLLRQVTDSENEASEVGVRRSEVREGLAVTVLGQGGLRKRLAFGPRPSSSRLARGWRD